MLTISSIRYSYDTLQGLLADGATDTPAEIKADGDMRKQLRFAYKAIDAINVNGDASQLAIALTAADKAVQEAWSAFNRCRFVYLVGSITELQASWADLESRPRFMVWAMFDPQLSKDYDRKQLAMEKVRNTLGLDGSKQVSFDALASLDMRQMLDAVSFLERAGRRSGGRYRAIERDFDPKTGQGGLMFEIAMNGHGAEWNYGTADELPTGTALYPLVAAGETGFSAFAAGSDTVLTAIQDEIAPKLLKLQTSGQLVTAPAPAAPTKNKRAPRAK